MRAGADMSARHSAPARRENAAPGHFKITENAVKEPTKADLAAAVARLTEENAALRDLLAAVRAYADVPHPADYDDRRHEYELERRVDAIAVWADGDQEDMAPDVYLLVMGDRAKHLREEAARPVRYQVRAEPADATRDQPASPDAAGVLAAAIAAGTPVVVTDDEPGPAEGEPYARCDSERVTRGNPLLRCSVYAGHAGLHAAITPSGATLAEWSDGDPLPHAEGTIYCRCLPEHDHPADDILAAASVTA